MGKKGAAKPRACNRPGAATGDGSSSPAHAGRLRVRPIKLGFRGRHLGGPLGGLRLSQVVVAAH